MLEKLRQLHQLLSAFEATGVSRPDRVAAARLASDFANRTVVQLSGDQKVQYEACALAAGRRLASDVEFLRRYAKWSQYAVVRDFCEAELDPRTSLFGGSTAKPLMPGEAPAPRI